MLEDAYRRLGFADAVDDDVFMKLVLARLVGPTSKADTIRVLEDLGVPAPGLRTIWRTLARCVEQGWRDKLATAACAHATRHGHLKLVLYDVTTLYFEAEAEAEPKPKPKPKPKTICGRWDEQGTPRRPAGPRRHADHPGRVPAGGPRVPRHTGETLTLLPVLRAFQDRHHVDGVMVVADAGMLSASILNQIEDAGFSFIVRSRISKAPYDLAEHFDAHGGVLHDGGDPGTKRITVSGPNARQRRVVCHYSAKRDRHDNHTLDKQVERAQKVTDGKRPLKKDRFVKLTGSRPAVDQALVDRARQLAGLKGYVTNIPAIRLAGREVVAAYHEPFQVERSFRMAKTGPRARPMFHHERDSIHAHFTIVFTALAISRHLQDTTGLSNRRVIRALRPLRDVTISINGNEIVATTPPGPDAHAILTATAGH